MGLWKKQSSPYVCPCCGGKLESDEWNAYLDDELYSVPVSCDNCGYSGQVHYRYETNFTEDDVARQFNLA